MLVFLDFEASSLAKRSCPIEVGWVFADGRSEAHFIRPAPSWTCWDEESEAIHHIPRSTLLSAASPMTQSRSMIEVLAGHDLLATRHPGTGSGSMSCYAVPASTGVRFAFATPMMPSAKMPA